MRWQNLKKDSSGPENSTREADVFAGIPLNSRQSRVLVQFPSRMMYIISVSKIFYSVRENAESDVSNNSNTSVDSSKCSLNTNQKLQTQSMCH